MLIPVVLAVEFKMGMSIVDLTPGARVLYSYDSSSIS